MSFLNLPVKGVAYSFEMSLTDQATGQLRANPTLAAGDVKVSKDGGAESNITTLPTAISSGSLLTVSLSSTEMNCDRIAIKFVDVAGSEWDSVTVSFPTVPATFAEYFEDMFDGTGYAGGTTKLQVVAATVSDKTNYALTASYDLYHATIDFVKDSTNDEYTIRWFKNGVRQTSGITSPTIQVVKRSDGTDLVASTSMTQIGSTGAYKYDEGTNRTTAGESYEVVVAATIDGSSRTFSRLVGRDA